MMIATRLGTTTESPDKEQEPAGNKTEFLGDRLMPRKTNGRHPPVKTNGAAVPPTNATGAPVEKPAQVPYNDAVREAKRALGEMSKAQWKIGELADNIEPIYSESTLAQFAKAIGIAACTVERYRDVYRAWRDVYHAWKENPDPGRELLSYSAARTLATHPNRADFLSDNPRLTKRDAEKIMKKYHERRDAGDDAKQRDDQQEEQTPPTGKDKWRMSEVRRWVKAVNKLALEAIGHAERTDGDLPPEAKRALRAAADLSDVGVIRAGAEALTRIANELEGVIAEPASKPERRPVKRVRYKADAAQAPAQA
jgi:hypothetical protein